MKLFSLKKILVFFLLLFFYTCSADGSRATKVNPGANSREVEYIGEFKEWTAPQNASRCDQIRMDLYNTNIVWFTQPGARRVSSFDVSTETFRDFVVPETYRPDGLVIDHNNILWFGEQGAGLLGRFDPSSETFEHLRLPYNNADPAIPFCDSDNNIWVADHKNSRIVLYNQNKETWKSFDTPTKKAWPVDIKQDQNGVIWFAEYYGNNIGTINLKEKYIGEVQNPTKDGGPAFLVIDSKDNIWYSQWNTNKLGCYKQNDATIVEYTIQKDFPVGPAAIAIDENDIIYIALRSSNQIARFDPKDETFRTFDLPTSNAGQKDGIIVGRDGNIWFTEFDQNKIGYLKITKRSLGQNNLKSTEIKSQETSLLKETISIIAVKNYEYKINHKDSSEKKKYIAYKARK